MIWTYSPDDPSLFSATDEAPKNALGLIGASLADPLHRALGWASYGIAVAFAVWGLRFVFHSGENRVLRRALVTPVALLVAASFAATHVPLSGWKHDYGLGGLLGDATLGALLTALPLDIPAALRLDSVVLAILFIATSAYALGVTWAECRGFFRFLGQGSVVVYAGFAAVLLSRAGALPASGTAFVVVRNHRMDDYRPYLWKTTDFGATWAAITAGLDKGVHLHAVREDPKKKGVLYLGTERGVMLSPDGGASWRSLQLNLPTVPVHDLVVKNDDLVVGTHGRSIWILDDLTAVRDTTADVTKKDVHVFPVRPATRWYSGWAGPTAAFTRRAVADNPDDGAAVWFSLAAGTKGDVTIEVADAAGKVIARAKGKFGAADKDDKDEDDEEPAPRAVKAAVGLNRFVWDMTHDGATIIPGAKVDSGAAGRRIPVSPGTYTVKLTAAGKTLTQPVEVRPDPRYAATKPAPTGYAEVEKLSLKVRDDITALSGTVSRLRAVKRQLALRKDLLKDRADAKDLLKASADLGKTLDEVEGKLHNPKAKVTYDIFAARGGAMLYSQFAWLLNNLTEADGPPTKAQVELADELGKELGVLTTRFEAVVAADIGKLNEAARKLAVPELYVPPVPKK